MRRAVWGLLAGLGACAPATQPTQTVSVPAPTEEGGETIQIDRAAPARTPAQVRRAPSARRFVPACDDRPDVHACKGLNDCKGLGGCKTAVNDCKGKNECKAMGGCKLPATDCDPGPDRD